MALEIQKLLCILGRVIELNGLFSLQLDSDGKVKRKRKKEKWQGMRISLKAFIFLKK